jgi:polyvinyl alcohol dehydrogenase (cytochrome)
MLGYDVGSTYWNKGETKISVKSAPSLTKAWEFDTTASVTSTPVIAGGRVYVASADLIALDLVTGKEVWRNAGIGAYSSLSLSDGLLFLHDASGIVHAFDVKDGKERWNHDQSQDDPGTLGFSSAVVTKDYVLTGGSALEELVVAANAAKYRGFVIALNKKDGTVAWKKYTVDEPAHGGSLWSTPSADEESGIVFAATGNNHGPPVTDTSDGFLAMKLKDGSGDLLWKNQIFANDAWMFQNFAGGPDNDFGANPIVFDTGGKKLVAGGNKGGDFWVIDRVKGTVLKTRTLCLPGSTSLFQGGVFVNGAWDGSELLVACNGPSSVYDAGGAPSTLLALDPLTLDVVWEQPLAGKVLGFMSVANGVGFVGTDKTLHAFDVKDGKTLLDFDTEATIATAPSVSNGYVVFGSGMSWQYAGATPGTKYYALKVP